MVTPVPGLKVTDAHAVGMTGNVTFGGFFITTVFVLLTVPQVLVTARRMVYVPGLVKLKTGLTDVEVVPLVK